MRFHHLIITYLKILRHYMITPSSLLQRVDEIREENTAVYALSLNNHLSHVLITLYYYSIFFVTAR
jgi:hypothetical protein